MQGDEGNRFLKCDCGPYAFTFFLAAEADGSLVGECAACRKGAIRTGGLAGPKEAALDKKAYQRDYMKTKYRPREKARKAERKAGSKPEPTAS